MVLKSYNSTALYIYFVLGFLGVEDQASRKMAKGAWIFFDVGERGESVAGNELAWFGFVNTLVSLFLG